MSTKTTKLWDYRFVKDYLRLQVAVREAFKRGQREIQVKYGEFYTREQWERESWIALNRRINLKGGLREHGRKFEPDYQTRLLRDCRRVREIVGQRIRHYQFESEECRSRFGHLLARHED